MGKLNGSLRELTEKIAAGAALTNIQVWGVYNGSDGEATKALYDRLDRLGAIGMVAKNLFRACKTSTRAKKYRGGDGRGSFRGQSYDTKAWSMANLATILVNGSAELGIRWGWLEDPAQVMHRWILYIDIPTGQVSFHTDRRLEGPAYPGVWDGARQSTERIVQWCGELLAKPMAAAA